ncbi:helix-turn-helix transcriptional regulator [Zobellia roscoffensis]|uniref:helix-turn-helix domain-containing protein n=1 Tax=Zobellia roscoffensis TaxID=2779508 RepID=UPI00188BF5CA|nr:helix-turn-helix transcriptional regulator [Zobellia roscoffensis]
MVNTTDFIDRLNELLRYYSLSASSFADKVNVQRSSISHLLSGRNKPSLDFVLKVINVFPEVNLYWLLNGKGSFPSEAKKEISQPTPSTKQKTTTIDLPAKASSKPEKNIEKIIIFYSDGSFESYAN